jgi:cation:H+ antiporter
MLDILLSFASSSYTTANHATSDTLAIIIFHSLVLAAFMALLVRSAIFAVDSIVKFSKMAGISELAAGFAIVSISTSAPEISVAVFSVSSNNVGLTLGDIFGSNVTNIGLIAALFLLISPIRAIAKKTLKSLYPFLVAAAAIPAILLLLVQDGSRFVGVALLVFFTYFMYKLFKSNHSNKNRNNNHRSKNNEPPDIRRNESSVSSSSSSLSPLSGSRSKQIIFFVIGMALVILSARFIVQSASAIAESTGLQQSVIGATIIALGTSLPELAVDIVSVRRRHLDLALGDIVGSSVAILSNINS